MNQIIQSSLVIFLSLFLLSTTSFANEFYLYELDGVDECERTLERAKNRCEEIEHETKEDYKFCLRVAKGDYKHCMDPKHNSDAADIKSSAQ